MLEKPSERGDLNVTFDNADRKLVLEAIKEYKKVIKTLMGETKKLNMKEYYKEKLDRIVEICKFIIEDMKE